MMLLILFIIASIITTIISIFLEKYMNFDGITVLIEFLSVVFCIVTIIMIIFSIGENSNGHINSEIAKYEILKQTIENIEEKEINIEKASILEDIIETNKILAKYKTLHDNKWVGIFYNDKIAKLDYLE